MELRRRLTMAGGVVLLALAVSVGPASAKQLEREHFEDSGSGVFEECGITIGFEFNVRGSFLAKAIGPNKLPHFQANVHGANTLTNLANGKQVTEVFNFMDKDRKVTDNGDGTLAIQIGATGGSRWYDSNRKLVFQDGGGIWFEILIDHGGTPTDPSDDEFIEFLGEVKDTGRDDITADNFCDQILSVIG
jgi:hypothetical protein